MSTRLFTSIPLLSRLKNLNRIRLIICLLGSWLGNHNAFAQCTTTWTGPLSVCANTPYTYIATYTSPTATYHWSVSNGTVSGVSSRTPSITWTSAGWGSIQLTVSDPAIPCSFTGNYTNSVQINAALPATEANGPAVVCPNSGPWLYTYDYVNHSGHDGAITSVVGGTITQYRSGSCCSPFPAGHDSVWVTWGSGTTGQIITTNYYLIGGGSGGTCSDNEVLNISLSMTGVNSPPAITPSGPTTICANGSVTLNASTGYSSYLWNNGATTPSITVSTAGVYTVTVNGGGPCGGVSAPVTVNVLQVPLTFFTTLTLCPAGIALAQAAPGYVSYLWSDGQTGDLFVTSQPGTYTVSATDASGCVSVSAPFTVNVVPDPSFVVSIAATQNGNLCTTGIVTLNADINDPYASYYWSNSVYSPVQTVASPGTYQVTVVNGAGCEASASYTIANPFPSVSITPAAPAICAGNSVTLNAGAGFASYLWSTGATSQSISASTAGTYSVTVTNAAGCSGTDSEVLTVNANPTVSISTAAPAICAGNSVTFNAGAGFASYLWSTGATSQSISASTAGTYSVTVTNADGCSGTDSEVLTVNANPTVSISPAAPAICAGNSVTLNAGAGFASYLWSTGATSQSISASTAGTYSVTVTNAAGCSGTDSEVLTVNANPTVSISPAAPAICAGNSVTLNAGAGFASYLWSTGATSQSISASTAGTYSVTVTNAAGCSGADSEVLTVNANPTVSISPAAPAICAGNSVTLNAGAGFASYLWSTGATSQSISASTAGTYSVTVTNAAGCSGADSEVLTIYSNPAPGITATNGGVLCGGIGGNFVTLTSTIGAASYLWSTGATTASITVSTPGTYSLTITTTQGCTNSASTTVTSFTSCQPPATLNVVSLTLNSATVSWSAAACANKYRVYYKPLAANNWSQMILNAPATSTVLTGLTPNTPYQWRMKANCTGGGISNFSPIYTFTTPPLRTNGDNAGAEPAAKALLLFPNPNSGTFSVQFDAATSGPQELCVYDATGKLILCETRIAAEGENQWQIQLPQVTAGMYLLRMGNESLRFQVSRD